MTEEEIRIKYEEEEMTQSELDRFIDGSSLVSMKLWETFKGSSSWEKAGLLIKRWCPIIEENYEIY